MGIHILRHFKEEITRATDKQLPVISNNMFRYTTKKLKNEAILSFKEYWMHYYVVLINVIIYSIYSKQDSEIPPL